MRNDILAKKFLELSYQLRCDCGITQGVASLVCVGTSHYSEDHSEEATFFCLVIRKRRGEIRARHRVASPASKKLGNLQGANPLDKKRGCDIFNAVISFSGNGTMTRRFFIGTAALSAFAGLGSAAEAVATAWRAASVEPYANFADSAGIRQSPRITTSREN